MNLPGPWRRWRARGRLTRSRVLAGVLVLAAVVGLGTVTAVAGAQPAVHQEDRFLEMPQSPGSDQQVSIDTSFFTTGSSPRPAVLLAHGFGGSKADEVGEARKLASAGYAVLTWSSRGFGHSTGQIGLDSPDGEVQDVKHLVDWLTNRPEVLKDKPGDPVVGITGASYGGAISLLAAAADPRIKAIAPLITWWDLPQALFPPERRGQRPGRRGVQEALGRDLLHRRLGR